MALTTSSAVYIVIQKNSNFMKGKFKTYTELGM